MFEIEEEKYEKEKPGIELTGDSLVFFKVVEAVLEERGKQKLTTLLQNFLNSCQGILKHCPGMSAFDGSWRKQQVTVLSIEQAKLFVGNDFFEGATCLFDEPLEGKNLSSIQTQQIFGTFFISSLIKLHGEITLQSLFQIKLRELAEKLSDNPLTNNAAQSQGLQYFLEIFQPNINTEALQKNAQRQFEAIFENLHLKQETVFIQLVTLFFLKPFPLEVQANADHVLKNPEQIAGIIADAFMSLLYKQSARSHAEPERHDDLPDTKKLANSEENGAIDNHPVFSVNNAKIVTHATYIETAFKIVGAALQTVSDKACTILGNSAKLYEFQKSIQMDVAQNFIFTQYFSAVYLGTFQKNDFNAFEAQSVREKAQKISQSIAQKLSEPLKIQPLLGCVVLAPKNPSLTVEDIEPAQYQLQHLNFVNGKRRCCNPRDRETWSALLNANPLVEALLLSQIPIANALQISQLDDAFKDVSAVMWFEPPLGLLGFACGVYALRNPKTLVNTPFRILKALSTSSVVLSKSLEIAILAHTTLFPADSRSGGIDFERFLTRVAAIPMTLALLSLVYNSISPNFKKRCCSKNIRRTFDFINYATTHWGLYQIIRTDIIKIVSKFETPDFSSDLDKWLFECFSAIPALVFAFTRVAPICASKRNAVGGNISETLNTAALYGFTIALGMKLIIDLYFSGSDNLPIEQTNFRRVFFPILLSASMAVMARFGRSFREFYDGNPEVIVLKISKADTLPDSNVPLLSLQEVKKLDEALEAPLDSQKHLEGRTILKMYDRHLLHASKVDNIRNNKSKRTRCCVVS